MSIVEKALQKAQVKADRAGGRDAEAPPPHDLPDLGPPKPSRAMLSARLSALKVLPSPGMALVTSTMLLAAGRAPSRCAIAFRSGHLIRRNSSSV